MCTSDSNVIDEPIVRSRKRQNTDVHIRRKETMHKWSSCVYVR